MARVHTQLTRRKEALDYLKSTGGATCAEVCAALGWSKSVGIKHLKDLRALGSVVRSDTRVGVHTVTGKEPDATIFRRVPPDKLLALRAANTRSGVTVHMGSSREHPIPNQGGQGAVRQRVGIQSSAG
jgi:hypothetical protein